MPVANDSPETKQGESIYDSAQEPFQSYEPESVQPTSTRPAPVTDPGTVGGTSGEDGEASADQQQAAAAQAEEPEPLPEFDERYREPFTGLLYLGRLTHTFDLWGHQIVIKTMTTEESAEIGLLVEKYEGTRARGAVYQTAVVGAAVVTVDGRDIPVAPLGPSLEDRIRVRYDYVAAQWMPPVREKIFEEIFNLEDRVRGVLDQMERFRLGRVDPWMEHHLRLAEARGSLRAPNSPVQDLALEMMLLIGQRQHQQSRLDLVRQTLLLMPVPDIERVHAQFPEYFPVDFLQQLAFAKATRDDGTIDPTKVDDSLLEWRTDVSPEEDDEITRWIAAREQDSASVAELDEEWK